MEHRTVLTLLGLMVFSVPATAWHPRAGRSSSLPHHPLGRFYHFRSEGIPFSSHDKTYPSPFPGYHWADATLLSTGPGAIYRVQSPLLVGLPTPQPLDEFTVSPSVTPATITPFTPSGTIEPSTKSPYDMKGPTK